MFFGDCLSECSLSMANYGWESSINFPVFIKLLSMPEAQCKQHKESRMKLGHDSHSCL